MRNKFKFRSAAEILNSKDAAYLFLNSSVSFPFFLFSIFCVVSWFICLRLMFCLLIASTVKVGELKEFFNFRGVADFGCGF